MFLVGTAPPGDRIHAPARCRAGVALATFERAGVPRALTGLFGRVEVPQSNRVAAPLLRSGRPDCKVYDAQLKQTLRSDRSERWTGCQDGCI